MASGKWETFFYRFVGSVAHYRKTTLLVIAMVVLLFSFQLKHLRFNNDTDIWFIKGDRSLEFTEKFRRCFGNNDDFVLLLIESKPGFSPRTFQLLSDLAGRLESEVPYLLDVNWIGTAEKLEGAGGEVVISPLMKRLPETREEILSLLEEALEDPVNQNQMVSRDGNILGMILEIDNYPTQTADPKKDVAPQIRRVLSDPSYSSLDVRMIGAPIIHHDFDRLTAKESLIFFLLCFVTDMAVVICYGNGWWVAAATAAIIAACMTITTGLIVLLGSTVNIAFIIVPTLIICVGIGDAIHVVSEFRDCRDKGMDPESAIICASGKVGLACLLTSLTTAAGFLSFLVVDIRPLQEMGAYSAAAVCIALILTFLIIPCTIGLIRDKPRRHVRPRRLGRSGQRFDHLLMGIFRCVVNHHGKIVVLFTLMAVLSVFGLSRVEVETNYVGNVLERVPLRQDYQFADERMGGSVSLEIMIDTGENEGILDPDFLRRMERFQVMIGGFPITSQTASVIDLFKKIDMALHNGEERDNSLPATREAAAQYLLLYEAAGGKYLERLVAFHYDIARIRVQAKSVDTRDVREFMQRIEIEASTLFGPGISVEMTGFLANLVAMNDLVKDGQKKSFVLALGVVTLIMTVVMGSWRFGLISMIPNIFPVIASLGLMGLFGIYMDLHVMASSAIIIGVAVDDTIHFFTRFKSEFNNSRNYTDALRQTFQTVGRPIFFTTVILVAGLCLLVFSSLLGVIKFGLLAGFAFFSALISDFFFAPALIMLLKPLGAENDVFWKEVHAASIESQHL